MIDARSDWNGEAAMEFIQSTAWEGLVRATQFLLLLIETALNKTARVAPGPGGYRGAPAGEPPRKRTGHGAGSVTDDYDEAGMKTRVGLQPGAKYMLYLELGSKAVTILAKAKPLVFWIMGKKIFARRVNKPAQAPRPWLLATVKKFWVELQEMAGSGAE